jgi:hypothetical protein
MAAREVSNELPESVRVNAATDYVNGSAHAHKILKAEYPYKLRLRELSAFLAGWDRAMETGHGELLAENLTLQDERFDLSRLSFA